MRKISSTIRKHLNAIRYRPTNGHKSVRQIDEMLEQIYYTKLQICSSVDEIEKLSNGGSVNVQTVDRS